MSKIVTGQEALRTLGQALREEGLSTAQKTRLLRRIAEGFTQFFGGTVRFVSSPDDVMDQAAVHIGWDERVPKNGGVYRNLDPDKTLEEWREEATKPKRLPKRRKSPV